MVIEIVGQDEGRETLQPPPVEHGRLVTVESFAVCAVHVFLALAIILVPPLMLIVAVLAKGWSQIAVWQLAWFPLAALEFCHMCRTYHFTEHRRFPLAVSLATEHPRFPLLLRPVVAAWWWAHFVAGVWVLLVMEKHFDFLWDSPGELALKCFTYAAVIFAATHSSASYLLLGVGAMKPAASSVERAWRWRWVLDVLVTGLAVGGALRFV